MKKNVLSGVLYSAAKVFALAFVLTALLFSAIGVSPARAATTWTVTSAADDGTANTGNCPGAGCRLRDALAAATAGDTIVFAAGLSGQAIRVVSTLTLSKNVVIDGSALASKITISGDTDNDGTGNVQVFYINSGKTVTINSLKIMKGLATNSSGAGIYNDNSTLTVRNSIFTSNSSPGYNGAAIRNYGGILTVIDSTFSNNSAAYGGAIYNSGTMTIKSSTFSSNNATYYGGAIDSGSSSGTIVNSTFNTNYASYGGAISIDTMIIKNNTISGNIATSGYGGGIYNNGGTIVSANNIITNSTGTDCRYTGSFITNTNNLIRDGSCLASLSGDPKLGPLARNGGPTQTMALLAGSPAVNAGNDSICAADPVNNLDQRGLVRPRGGHCDIGAYEAPFSIANYLSTSTADGWVLESSEASSTGLTMSNVGYLFLGDDGARRQYRNILSFNTSNLPDTAVIGSVILKIKQQGIVGSGNPVGLLQGFMADVKTGTFGATTLEASDFQTATSISTGPFAAAPSGSWYSLNISNAKTYINKLATNNGLTQIRIRFKLDDNNDNIANFIKLYGGEFGLASGPQLSIQYYVP